MTFEQAIAHVRTASSASVAAYAFIPTVRRGATAGGAIYVIAFDADAAEDEDEDPIIVEYVAGIFGTGEGQLDLYDPDDVPDEALDLAYEPTTTYDATISHYDTEVALAVLRGATLEQALASFEAAGPAHGPNATPEAVMADLLIAHGMPTVLPTSAGSLPAAIVLLDDDDPRLGGLVDAFGGVVVVVEDPGAPGVELGAADPEAEEHGAREAGDEDSIDDAGDADVGAAEAAWVGVGRGAVLATLLATRALPEWERDLPADLAEAWRALLAFATAAIEAPADAEGRRPKPVYQELRRLAAKVDRLMARQIADHADLIAFVAAAVDREMADGTFIDADLALPSRTELDAPVPLPGSRWAETGADTEPSDDRSPPPADHA